MNDSSNVLGALHKVVDDVEHEMQRQFFSMPATEARSAEDLGDDDIVSPGWGNVAKTRALHHLHQIRTQEVEGWDEDFRRRWSIGFAFESESVSGF